MRLTRLRSSCPDTDSCPTLYRTDHGTVVVQGFVVSDIRVLGAIAQGETVVEVPAGLLTGLAISGPVVSLTERGTVLVQGVTVTDPEALATLRLPLGEAAVEIHLSLPANMTW